MPQLSLYVDDETMNELRSNAAKEGLSLSRYTANALKSKTKSMGWPEGYFETLREIACRSDWMDEPRTQLFDFESIPALDEAVDEAGVPA